MQRRGPGCSSLPTGQRQCFLTDKKRASKLFDGEEVEPEAQDAHETSGELIGVQFTHHLRNGFKPPTATYQYRKKPVAGTQVPLV